jgi:hypothetical protein
MVGSMQGIANRLPNPLTAIDWAPMPFPTISNHFQQPFSS